MHNARRFRWSSLSPWIRGTLYCHGQTPHRLCLSHTGLISLRIRPPLLPSNPVTQTRGVRRFLFRRCRALLVEWFGRLPRHSASSSSDHAFLNPFVTGLSGHSVKRYNSFIHNPRLRIALKPNTTSYGSSSTTSASKGNSKKSPDGSNILITRNTFNVVLTHFPKAEHNNFPPSVNFAPAYRRSANFSLIKLHSLPVSTSASLLAAFPIYQQRKRNRSLAVSR